MQSKPRKQNASKPPLGLNSFLVYGVSGFISFFCFLCGCSGLSAVFLSKSAPNIVQEKVASNAIFVSKIGDVKSFTLDLPSSKMSTEALGGDAIVMHYRVSGTSGKGKVIYTETRTGNFCALMMDGTADPIDLKVESDSTWLR